jgi:hypothetical protein
MSYKHNDPRAGHEVFVYPTATNVKFRLFDYVISLASDGQETFVYRNEEIVHEVPGTHALSVHAAIQWVIDSTPE